MTRSPPQIRLAGGALELGEWPGDEHLAPIVLLHEGLGSVRLWREFPALVQARTGRRVIAFSRYGHGWSDPPARPRTPAFFHEEALRVLPELLTELEVKRPVVLGHSDGASIGLIHAASHPVDALVLVAPHVLVEDITVAAIRETRESFVGGDLRRRMERHHRDPDEAFWGWCNVWLDPAFSTWSLEEEVDQVTAPLLLVQGTEDPYGSLTHVELIEQRARGPVDRLVLPGGHSPHLEHPSAVVTRVAEFLGGMDGRARSHRPFNHAPRT